MVAKDQVVAGFKDYGYYYDWITVPMFDNLLFFALLFYNLPSTF